MIDTTFSAKEPALGYQYQIKYALFLLLSHSKHSDNVNIRIECLDDIEVIKDNSLELIQTKLHIKRPLHNSI